MSDLNTNVLCDSATIAIDPTIPQSIPLVPPTVVDTVTATVVTQSDKPKRTRKPKVVVEVKRGRGRPNVYVGAILALMISMVKACHNSSLVRSVLTGLGTAGKPLTAEQKKTYKEWRASLLASTGLEQLKKPMTISLPMLGKYAKEAGVDMPLGKPSASESVKQIDKLKSFIDAKAKKAVKKEPVAA